MAITNVGMGQVIGDGKENQWDHEGNRAIPTIPDRPVETSKSKQRDETVEENVRQA